MNGTIKINLKLIMLTFCIVSASIIILFFSSYSVSGITDGLLYTVNYLVPSLFPFMVISSFTMNSGAYKFIGKFFSFVTRRIFKLPEPAAAAIILGLTGGFPVGAKCVDMLYSSGEIDEIQANRMMTFCVCSGPSFLITAIGTIMLHNTSIGIILYVSQIVSAVIIAFLTGCRQQSAPVCSEKKVRNKSIAESFVISCSDGAYSVLELTSFVVIFSMFMSIIEKSGFNNLFSDAINFFDITGSFSEIIMPIFFEVTGACRRICDGGFQPWVLSFAVGFGGLCVHLQILHILKSVKINKFKFFIFRFINAVLSSIITYVIFLFINPSAEVFSFKIGENTFAESVSGSYIGAAALIVMCILFLLSFKRSYYPNRITKGKFFR